MWMTYGAIDVLITGVLVPHGPTNAGTRRFINNHPPGEGNGATTPHIKTARPTTYLE